MKSRISSGIHHFVNNKSQKSKNTLFSLLPRYKGWILGLLALSVFGKGLSLLLPRMVANGIDAFNSGHFDIMVIALPFLLICATMLISDYILGIIQTYASERVTRDLREQLAAKISRQSYAFVQNTTASKLLTNLTSDMDAVKMFVSQGIVIVVSSLFILLGASVMLITTNWKLGLSVLVIIPVMGFMFYGIFSNVGALFGASQKIIDRLNKTINESILGATLIRILHGQQSEKEKFIVVNTAAKENGLKILRVFASMIPLITFISSCATLIILAFGGHLVIVGQMSIGQLAAFNSYVGVLIFPMLMLGFMSNMMARSSASYARIAEVLDAPEIKNDGTLVAELTGDLELRDVNVSFGETPVLKHVSFKLPAKTRTAILGPTAAGKTQLLNVLTGLTPPTSGDVLYDGKNVSQYDSRHLHAQIGMVFQDSVVFNLSIHENIAFGREVDKNAFDLAVTTAELKEFVDTLPEGYDTLVSERGTSLSGGQKQRLMLARALANKPKVLLLDDFTARVDANTEHRILENVRKNYPDITLVSVTQKITSVRDYDHIVLLMEGEVLAQGTHDHLMETSPEYVQIYESQRSTNQYEH
ncbi:ABC transporter ATP-binding protein/permease [Candidatus Uhrbacteria bacterium]|nr:ABC transporter ATP-binding protein/permease [Candidatus Uhrbacteria bacterium]